MTRRFLPRLAVAMTVGVVALFAVVGSASAAPDGPDGQIGSIKTTQGVIQYIFSAGNLPKGATLDPASVVVTAGSTTLEATASAADAAQTPQSAPIREVFLVLDVSGSMLGDGIAGARQAALSYARALPKDVRVGLITFNNKTRVLLTPTTNRSAVASAVAKVRASGGTALYDGVRAAARALANLPVTASRRLLILSDGDDTSSVASLGQATAALAAAGVSADVVAFRLPGNRAALQSIASASGGRVLPANNASDLGKALTAAASAFRQQVLVTVKVPAELSNKRVSLTTTLNAGSESVAATQDVLLPTADKASESAPLTITPPKAKTSNAALMVILAVTFAVLLVVLLVALFLPVLSAERARKQARLAEVHRYRVIGAVGSAAGLEPVKAAETSQITQRTLAIADRTVRARGQRENLVASLDHAGLRMRPEEWAVLQLAAVIVLAALVAVVSGSFIGALVGGVLGWLACRYFLQFKTGRRRQAFEDQLPDTLQLLAGSLRSGFSMSQAISGVVREGTEPAAAEFARALAEVRIGAELEDALDSVAERMRCSDLTLVVMAMRIAREVGGNLAEVLQNTVGTMRDRAQLRGTVRVLSAEGRISAKVLIALPILLGGFMLLFKPGYMTPLVTTVTGALLLIIGAALLLIGAFWLNRLVKIEV